MIRYLSNLYNLALLLLLPPVLLKAQVGGPSASRNAIRTVPLDSMSMSDPFILADAASKTYYMTGSGGSVWKSADLKMWQGPFSVVNVDTSSWMGTRPAMWASEIHAYQGKYYYFSTFTNNRKIIDSIPFRSVIPRRASHILVAGTPMGPFKPMGPGNYLPANEATLDGTLWIENGKPFMIYCREWLQFIDGTIDAIPLKSDLSAPDGKSFTLFRASDAPWVREMNTIKEITNGRRLPGWVTDGPYLFKTKTGRLGMIWSSWSDNRYALGVSYSSSGNLHGPWTHEPDLLVSNNSGHGMLFHTFEGKLLMSLHYQATGLQRSPRKPMLMEVDDSGDKLKILSRYNP